jgi:hypothetical protein
MDLRELRTWDLGLCERREGGIRNVPEVPVQVPHGAFKLSKRRRGKRKREEGNCFAIIILAIFSYFHCLFDLLLQQHCVESFNLSITIII